MGTWHRLTGIVAAVVGLAALALPAAPAGAAATVTGWNLVSTTRVGLTTYDYTYTINVSNTTPGLTGTVATVTSSVPSTVVLKGTVSLGTLGISSSVTSSDTFKIQVDRSVAFDPTKLVWKFSGTAFLLTPNVVGLTQAAATTAITNGGLKLGTVNTAASSTVIAGKDRKSTRLNSSHSGESRMPSSA